MYVYIYVCIWGDIILILHLSSVAGCTDPPSSHGAREFSAKTLLCARAHIFLLFERSQNIPHPHPGGFETLCLGVIPGYSTCPDLDRSSAHSTSCARALDDGKDLFGCVSHWGDFSRLQLLQAHNAPNTQTHKHTNTHA